MKYFSIMHVRLMVIPPGFAFKLNGPPEKWQAIFFDVEESKYLPQPKATWTEGYDGDTKQNIATVTSLAVMVEAIDTVGLTFDAQYGSPIAMLLTTQSGFDQFVSNLKDIMNDVAEMLEASQSGFLHVPLLFSSEAPAGMPVRTLEYEGVVSINDIRAETTKVKLIVPGSDKPGRIVLAR